MEELLLGLMIHLAIEVPQTSLISLLHYLLKLSLILQTDSLFYIAWLLIAEKIVIPVIMIKIKLSLRSVL